MSDPVRFFTTFAMLVLAGSPAAMAGPEIIHWTGGMQITNPARNETVLRLRYHEDHAGDDGILLVGDKVKVRITLPDDSNRLLAAQTMYRWYRAKKEETSRDFFGNTDTTLIHPSGEKKGPEPRYCQFDDKTIKLTVAAPADGPNPLVKPALGGSDAHPVYEMEIVVGRQTRLSELLVGAITCAAPTEQECQNLRPAGEDWEWKAEEFQQQQPGELLGDLPDHKALKVDVTIVREMVAPPSR